MKSLLFLVFACMCGTAHASSTHPTDEYRKEIPTVVLDIDNTLCRHIPNDRLKPADIFKASPETILIPYYEGEEPTQRGFFMHAFFPGIPEMLLILREWGWDVSFFSKAVERRQRRLVPAYLEQALAPYFTETDGLVKRVMGSRMGIYSRDHMHIQRSATCIRVTDTTPMEKKDLARIGLDPEHAVLVDDNKSYAVEGEQSPPLCVSATSAHLFEEFHLKGNQHNQSLRGYDASHNAAYILGIFDHCREYMKLGSTFRAALRNVLEIPREFNSSHQWVMVGPGLEVKPGQENHRLVLYYRGLASDHIKRGAQLIEQYKQKRLGKPQSQISSTPYEDLMEKMYGVRDHELDPLRTSQVRREDMWQNKVFQSGHLLDVVFILGVLYIVYQCTI